MTLNWVWPSDARTQADVAVVVRPNFLERRFWLVSRVADYSIGIPIRHGLDKFRSDRLPEAFKKDWRSLCKLICIAATPRSDAKCSVKSLPVSLILRFWFTSGSRLSFAFLGCYHGYGRARGGLLRRRPLLLLVKRQFPGLHLGAAR